ncbi:hypothetical protein JCM11251_001168 [Rhodosporidiobolus azoricus]
MWSTADRGYASGPPFDLDLDEEERLADEWGLSHALSHATSDVGESRPVSPVLEGDNAAGVGLARFAMATAMSEAGLLDQERKAEALAEAGADDLALIETRSMPDLDRSRMLSFADAVLSGLDERLKEKTAVKTVPDERAVAAMSDDEYHETRSEGPRIKIIERTATQRRERLRTQSLGPMSGLTALPSFDDLTAVTEATSSTSGGVGIASRDSLFLGPRARAQSSLGMASSRPLSAYSAAPTRRGSFEALSSPADALTSRLSIAIPPRTSTSGPPSPTSANSLHSPSSRAPPRPSNSFSLATTPVEPSMPGFTSRFDPNFIAAQRAELLKERPQFANPDAGKPPKVVLMPAPLAGKPPSQPKKPRTEGPGSDAAEEEEEEPEEEPEPEKDERPAGALYGRSLMDVIAERKAVQKSRTKAFVSGQDGRRSMFDWKETSPAAQDALAKLEGGSEKEASDQGDLPLALVPAGGAHLQKQKKERLPASKSTVSIFGPDLIYQRELARAKEIEAEERAEREKVEAIEAAKREKERLKEERRRSRGVLKKGDRRKSAMGPAAVESSREWEARERSARAEEGRVLEQLLLNDASNIRMQYRGVPREAHPENPRNPGNTHTSAPSLSIPAGLGPLTSSASGEDWFRAPSPPVKLTNDSEDEEEDQLYRPRPISQLALRNAVGTSGGISRRAFESDSETEDDEEEEETQPQPTATRARRPSLSLAGVSCLGPMDLDVASPLSPITHLPLPGEASSIGHDRIDESSSIAETDEQPLGLRYSRQSLTIQRQAGIPDSEDEDEEPLGKRYSRQSLSLPLILPMDQTGGDRLDPDLGGEGDEEQESEGYTGRNASAMEDDDSEDDKPLGARFSACSPDRTDSDDDNVPLAIHRLSLAPTFASAPANRFQPSATLHAIDDDGKTVQSNDSDDRPLGLRAGGGAAPAGPQLGGFFPSPFQPASVSGYPAVLPAPQYSQSQLFPPPLAAMQPLFPPAMPMMPQPPPLAVAQMQMHAAMQQQQAATMGIGVGGDTVGGPASGIERWRRGVL